MATGISYVPLTPELCEEWDCFCAESKYAWFWHTTDWLDYNIAYRPSLNPISQSFLVYDGAKLVAVCPLIIHAATAEEPSILVSGYPSFHGMIPALASNLSSKTKKDILHLCLERIDAIAERYQIKQSALCLTPLSESGQSLTEVSEQLAQLRQADYLETVWLTQVIDLSEDIQKLRKQMRKGHRYDVNQGERLFQTIVLSGPQSERALFDAYVRLHELAAGRKTRPQETFDMMYAWIQKNKAMLTLCRCKNEYIGACLIILDKDGGYYASSCVHPEHINEPVGHALQWTTIAWLKEHGYRLYEIGLMRYGAVPHDSASPKEVRISHFERGFGGRPVMFLLAEKWYDSTWYLNQNLGRSQSYIGERWPEKPNE